MASLEAGRTLPWMRWKVEQNGHLARMRPASLEAMEIERKCKTDTWLGGGKQGAGLEAGNCSKGETWLG